MIDFADGRVGPAEYEFAAPVEFLFKGEPGLLRAFLLAYGVPATQLNPERSKRMLAWALSHRYGSLRRMLGVLAGPTPRSLSELASRLYRMD